MVEIRHFQYTKTIHQSSGPDYGPHNFKAEPDISERRIQAPHKGKGRGKPYSCEKGVRSKVAANRAQDSPFFSAQFKML